MEDLELKGSAACPADGAPLGPKPAGGAARICPACQGALFTEARLALIIRHHGVDRLRAGAPGALRSPLRACPGCGRDMRIYDIENIEIDACAFCPCVWMDADEFPAVRAALDRMQAARGQVRGLGPVPEPRIGPLDLPGSESPEFWQFADMLADLLDMLLGGLP